jgi:hypothetical protein
MIRQAHAANCGGCATVSEEDDRSPPLFRICRSWCIFDRWWSAAARRALRFWDRSDARYTDSEHTTGRRAFWSAIGRWFASGDRREGPGGRPLPAGTCAAWLCAGAIRVCQTPARQKGNVREPWAGVSLAVHGFCSRLAEGGTASQSHASERAVPHGHVDHHRCRSCLRGRYGDPELTGAQCCPALQHFSR